MRARVILSMFTYVSHLYVVQLELSVTVTILQPDVIIVRSNNSQVTSIH